jgi:cell division protein FtsN
MAKIEQGSSRMDTVLKMLLIAFVSLLAFSSGVYFGKQMSDSDHQLKALESDFNTQSTLNAENSEEPKGGATGEEKMGDDEVATLSDKYVNAAKETVKREVASTEDAPATQHGSGIAAKNETKTETKAVAPKAPAKVAAHEEANNEKEAAPAAPVKTAGHVAAPVTVGKPDLSAAHRAAERVANNASPVANPKPKPIEDAATRVPTSLPKTVGTNGTVEFTVQVASYPTSDAAKSYANDLVKKGFPAFPVEANVNGRTWYRVSVGSFKSMKDATTYRAQLLKQADLQNAIVQKITR